jgi:hypothetical protein
MNRVDNDSPPVRLSHTFLVLLDSSQMTDDNELTGPIPSEIGNLSVLNVLYLCEWASMNRADNDSPPVRLSHTFLVLLNSSRMTDKNALTDPMPKAEIEGLDQLGGVLCRLGKSFREMFLVKYTSRVPMIHDVCSFILSFLHYKVGGTNNFSVLPSNCVS